MVLGMFRLTETAGMSAAASYGARSTHQITYDAPSHGHITVEPENAAAGDTVTVTFTEQDGCPFRGWSANNASVTFADASALTTTFVMPDDDVHITAAFKTPSATVTPPAAKDLTYNGEAQELVTAGTAVGGTMMYRLGENGEFSTEIPKATEAGEYTVYYMVEDPEGTASTEPQSIKVTIKTSDSETTVEGTDVTYGDTLTLTANVKRAETLAADSGVSMFADTNNVDFYANGSLLGTAEVVYEDTDSDSGTAVLEINTGNKQLALGANTITAEYGGSVNLNGSGSGELAVNMNAKPIGYTVSAESKTYDGTTAVNVTLTPTGLVEGDSVTITAVGNLPSANAGEYTTVDLTDSNRYRLREHDTYGICSGQCLFHKRQRDNG